MHSFRFIGACQGVFVFWIVRDVLLLQKGCDRIVIELEPGLYQADFMINAVVVRSSFAVSLNSSRASEYFCSVAEAVPSPKWASALFGFNLSNCVNLSRANCGRFSPKQAIPREKYALSSLGPVQ